MLIVLLGAGKGLENGIIKEVISGIRKENRVKVKEPEVEEKKAKT
jgi:hypothetical protein